MSGEDIRNGLDNGLGMLSILHDLICGKDTAAAKAAFEQALSTAIDGSGPYIATIDTLHTMGDKIGNWATSYNTSTGMTDFVRERNNYRNHFLMSDTTGQNELLTQWRQLVLTNSNSQLIASVAPHLGSWTPAAIKDFTHLARTVGAYNGDPNGEAYLTSSGQNVTYADLLNALSQDAAGDPAAFNDLTQGLESTPTPISPWWNGFVQQEMGGSIDTNWATGQQTQESNGTPAFIADLAVGIQAPAGYSGGPNAWIASFEGTPPKPYPNSNYIPNGLALAELDYEQQLQASGGGLPGTSKTAEKDSAHFAYNALTPYLKAPYGSGAGLAEQVAQGCNNNSSGSGGGSGSFNYGATEGNPIDPNYIVVSPGGSGAQGWVQSDDVLQYTIHFENDPSATLPAVNIRVVAQLAADLNPASLANGPSSFAGTQFSFDAASRTMTWELQDINLPPDTNPPNGEGWVSFSASPVAGLATGTTISESAQVFFDFNPPVSTATVVRTINATPPSVTLNALPTSETPGPVQVSWQGQSQAGIASYTLYLSEDGGTLAPVQTTTNTADTIEVAAGHTYGLAVQATDVTGLSSPMPTEPQMSFAVATPASPSSQSPAGLYPASTSIGSAGGTLATPDGTFRVTVPAGAVPVGQSLQVGASATPASGTPTLPGGLSAASAYVTVSGPTLHTPVTASMSYDASALGGLLPLRLGVWQDGSWRYLPTAVDSVSGTVSFAMSGPGTFVVLANTQRFSDVPAGYWAGLAIDRLLAAGIINGFPDGAFQPEAPVTRAQFVKMLVLALGLKPVAGIAPFSDVKADAWYAPYVAAAVQAHVVQGITESTFGPDEPLTREQMAVLLVRALNLKGRTTLTFSDASQIAPWAVGAVQTAVAAGYLNGLPGGVFQPLGDTTRAQAAKVLSLVLQQMAP